MRFSLLFISFLSIHFFCSGQNIKPAVYEIDIHKEINTTTWLYLSNGMKEAREKKADAIIIHLNTYGGALAEADSMRSAILYSPIPVYAFIDNNAASAGALIALACKKIYMRKGANIGAATVVDQGGIAMPDKYQSYMRSIIRATAEAHGKDTLITGTDTLYQWKRDPRIAEAMVDERIHIPNLADSGKVLTLTAEEAVHVGFCDGIAESVEEVISNYLKYSDYSIQEYKPSLYDNIKGFLLNPVFQAFLIMIIIAGIYFELQSPGIGFPSIAAGVAAILYFSPLYIDGLAQHWEIIIFIVGLLLVLLEIFVIPGFGVAGITGIILTGSGLTLALINNYHFSFEEVTVPDLSRSILTVLSGILLGFILMLYLTSRIGRPGLFRTIALNKDLETSRSVDPTYKNLIGKAGKTLTVLRPSGKIIIEGEIYDAVSSGEFIEKEESIKVIKFENSQFYVERLERKD
jgi:Membrane-bound serine protease (ClpP class)